MLLQPEFASAILQLAKNKMRVSEINLLPYHRLGKDKYTGLGRVYLMGEILPPAEEHMEILKKHLRGRGYES